MAKIQFILLSLLLSISPGVTHAQGDCVTVVPLTDQQVKNTIDRERALRNDLPAVFPNYRWQVKRQGCYYIYAEYGIPEAFHYENVFKLNQLGAIVDAEGGDKVLTCPSKVLSESDLAEIIKNERQKHGDLPPPFQEYKVEITRTRCLYYYYENALPDSTRKYVVFIVDPFGQLMEFFRG